MTYRKYGAKKTVVDNITFASKHEADDYIHLKFRLRAGEITDLVLQPKFVLQEGFTYNGKKERPINYVADFQYKEDGKDVVADSKGMRTEIFKLKRKLFLFKYPQYTFLET